MSAEATFWAWRHRGLSSSQKLVLLCLSDCHNADTNRCDPSFGYIAEKTCLDKKTVSVAIHQLTEMGLIYVQKRPGSSQNYSMNLTQIWGTPKTGIPKNGVTQNRGDTIPKNGPGPYPKTGTESITEPKRESKSNTSQKIKNASRATVLDFSTWPQAPSNSILADYKKLRQAKRAPLTQTVVNNMAKALAELNDQFHLPVDQVLTICCERGWQGLKTDWILNHLSKSSDQNLGGQYATRQRVDKQTPLERIREQARNVLSGAVVPQGSVLGDSPMGQNGVALWPQVDEYGGEYLPANGDDTG